ncbi:MAG: hypothetical protein DHS20C01_26240 [marine bacterium B5-7]|nr:MAG: hypothetical protein DHS20C01_26240 [marine bacterium B5-7]
MFATDSMRWHRQKLLLQDGVEHISMNKDESRRMVEDTFEKVFNIRKIELDPIDWTVTGR